MTKKILIALAISISSALCIQAKEKLRVLYVGGSPNVETVGGAKIDDNQLQKSIKERSASFAKFLRQRFTNVTVVNGPEYTPAMSADYDVTVFDGKPNPIRPLIHEKDASGKTIRFERPAYLPDDFDRAALCIANASEDIGRSVGTKNDWYCLCLDNYALGWNKEHPIFKGPFKVKINSEMRPTPTTAVEQGIMHGVAVPPQTEMWKVAEKSYSGQNNGNIRIGMVSRPGGYLDSPETEIISGGTSAKTLDAVAIGRHGNFFHWGYAADPDGLTPAGREALANSIVYISKFNGKPIIARKKNEGIVTRNDVALLKYLVTKDAWNMYHDTNIKYYHTMDSILKAIAAKKANGEKLSAGESTYENFPPMQKTVQIPYSEHIKKYAPKLYHYFGEDAEEYARYYDRNMPFFRPEATGYQLDIDEELRTLGYGNNDIRMLDNAISHLEKQTLDAPIARKVLERYTLCRFATPQEWRNWFETYKDKLFFTESGGWLWLVNTLDKSVPGNDYSVLAPASTSQPASTSAGSTDKQNPVALKGEVVKNADGTRDLVLTMTVHPGYHAYASVDNADPFLTTEVSVDVPKGIAKNGNIKMPAAKPTSNATSYFEGTVQFRQRISGNASGTAEWTIKYQVCDNTVCLRPETKTIRITL